MIVPLAVKCSAAVVGICESLRPSHLLNRQLEIADKRCQRGNGRIASAMEIVAVAAAVEEGFEGRDPEL